MSMLVYYGVAGLAAFLGWFSQRIDSAVASRRDKNEPSSGLLSARMWTPVDFGLVAILVAFSGLRYYVGTDYGLNSDIFGALVPNDWARSFAYSPVEPGFTLLEMLIRQFTSDAAVLFWVCSVLTVVPVYAVLRRFSASVAFSVLLYVLLASYVTPFNVVRQGLAVAVVFWATSYVFKRKVAWVFFIALASTIHVTALLAAVALLLFRNWKPTLRSTLIMLLSAFLLGGVLLRQPAVIELAGRVNPRYAEYLSGQQSGIGTYLIAATYAALLLIALSIKGAPETDRWLAYSTLAPVFLLLGTVAEVIGRMSIYFDIFFILLLPARIKASNHPVGLTLGVTALAAIYFGLYLGNFGDLVPYRTGP